MKKIRFNDFTSDPPSLIEDQERAVSSVIRSGWYVLGPAVKRFEDAFANFCAVSHCVGVGNGMDAIEIILRCRKIGHGDEVITTPMTAFATVLAILRVGAKPVFADIEPTNGLLSLEEVRCRISNRTKAVVLVHLYGQMSRMNEWKELCDSRGIDLIEDCAQAHGASFAGIKAGGWGIAGAYSFYPTKNLGCVGDGGAIVTNNKQLSNMAAAIRNYGQAGRYEHVTAGLNSRLDEIQAAILLQRLEYLESFNHARKSIANQYISAFENSPGVGFKALDSGGDPSNHVRHLFVGKVKDPDEFVRKMAESSIEVLRHYPICCHKQQALSEAGFLIDKLPVAESFADRVVSLPCHPNLNHDDVTRVAQTVIKLTEGESVGD